MTNQTIDGVSRDAFKWALEQLEEDGNKGCGYFDSLRSLLDAPAPRAEFKKVEMAHVMNALEDVRGKPVLTSNQCHDLARALNDRLLSPLQFLAMPAEYLAAAQPQGEPVAWKNFDGEGGFDFTEDKETAERWKISNGSFTDWLTPLYAEQPTPVAVITYQQVFKAYEYAESHPHKYLRGTTNWCAAVAHSLNTK